MTRFYLLPARTFVGQQYASLLKEFFPGQSFESADMPDLAERLAASVAKDTDAIVIFEEDLADDAPLEFVLRRDFGAGPGDDIVDIRAGTRRMLARRAAA